MAFHPKGKCKGPDRLILEQEKNAGDDNKDWQYLSETISYYQLNPSMMNQCPSFEGRGIHLTCLFPSLYPRKLFWLGQGDNAS
jgi:hypothetical protein